jgi:hypothetical protein
LAVETEFSLLVVNLLTIPTAMLKILKQFVAVIKSLP